MTTVIQTATVQRQDVLFHHGDTEGTEISQRHQGSPCIFVYSVSTVVNKVLEFLELGFPQLAETTPTTLLEANRLDNCWISDSLAFRNPWFDGLTIFAYIAYGGFAR